MPLNDEERKILDEVEGMLNSAEFPRVDARRWAPLAENLQRLRETKPPPAERSKVVFVDTETTGLDPEWQEIWECAAIEEDGTEHVWQLPVDLGRADAIALKIGGFHERRWPQWYAPDNEVRDIAPLDNFAEGFAEITRGCHLVGAVISFDERRLDKLLRANGALPEWHYHLLCVENLMVGHIAARAALMRQANGEGIDGSDTMRAVIGPPWHSTDLSHHVGIDPDDPAFAPKHSALGDARWARAVYYAVMGIPAPPSEDS